MTYEDTREDAAVALALAIERQRRLIEALEQSSNAAAAEAARRILASMENALNLIAPPAS